MPPRSRHARSPVPEIDARCLARPVEPEVDPAVPHIIHPGDEHLHRFWQFAREDDRTDRDRFIQRAARGFEPLRPISWSSLALVQLQIRAETTCGPHWRNLFSISDSVCRELAIEFFSTVHLLSPLTDYEREDALTFRLGGHERRMSIRRFAVLMGLYTEEECDTPAFRDGITDWPAEVEAHQFWTTIGVGEHGHPVPKSTRLRDPLHRILHRAIVFSLASSATSSGSVTLHDLFFLYCIISGRPCQIAVCLARYLFSARQGREAQPIYGGGYVHRLARAMGILTPADFEALTLSHLAVPINMDMMIRMKVARKDGARHILLGIDEQPYVHPEAGPPADEAQEQPAHPPGPPRGRRRPAQAEPLPRVYQRSRPDSPQRIMAAITRVECSQAEIIDSQAEIREIQRLEYEHAEAYRQYHTRVLQIIAGGLTEPIPDAPVRPQRLVDLLAGASTSGAHHQPPP